MRRALKEVFNPTRHVFAIHNGGKILGKQQTRHLNYLAAGWKGNASQLR